MNLKLSELVCGIPLEDPVGGSSFSRSDRVAIEIPLPPPTHTNLRYGNYIMGTRCIKCRMEKTYFFFNTSFIWEQFGNHDELKSAASGTNVRVRKVASFSIFWDLDILFCEISDCKALEFLV